jgi:hypothetical protein
VVGLENQVIGNLKVIVALEDDLAELSQLEYNALPAAEYEDMAHLNLVRTDYRSLIKIISKLQRAYRLPW